jgi:quinolinate synthase
MGMIETAPVPTGAEKDFVTRVPLPPQQLDALSRDILALKRKLNAIILAHNY